MNFKYVLGFVVLRDVIKSLSCQFSFVYEKDNPKESSIKSLGGMTRPDDKVGSQIGRVTTPASPGPVLTGRRDQSRVESCSSVQLSHDRLCT